MSRNTPHQSICPFACNLQFNYHPLIPGTRGVAIVLQLILTVDSWVLANLILLRHPAGTIKNSDNVKKINIAILEPPLFISRKDLRSLDHNTFTIMLLHLQ